MWDRTEWATARYRGRRGRSWWQSVDCTCSEYGDLTPAGGSKNFERPRSNFFEIFYYTLNIFIGKNTSKVASIDETGHRD